MPTAPQAETHHACTSCLKATTAKIHIRPHALFLVNASLFNHSILRPNDPKGPCIVAFHRDCPQIQTGRQNQLDTVTTLTHIRFKYQLM
jgi:hypothetical protein